MEVKTVNVTVQLALAFKTPPLRLRLRLPPLYVAVPLVHVVPELEPLRLTGKALAATATPVSWLEAFGFEIVSVSVEVEMPFDAIEVGENEAEMVGAVTELTVSVPVVAVPPAAEFVAETAPVV